MDFVILSVIIVSVCSSQLYQQEGSYKVHVTNCIFLFEQSEPNLLEHEDDADRWDKLAERALKMKVYGRNVQLNSSLYSEVISNSVATMAMGLQTSESNTSEVIKVSKENNIQHIKLHYNFQLIKYILICLLLLLTYHT